MAVSRSSSSSLELTMSMPGFVSSPSFPSSGKPQPPPPPPPRSASFPVFLYDILSHSFVLVAWQVKDLDINQVPSGAAEEEWISAGMEDEEESTDGAPPRKKLRLSKEQSRLLEESFRQHHSLNPRQKEALALQLKLRPRQVEVWFQNRRARYCTLHLYYFMLGLGLVHLLYSESSKEHPANRGKQAMALMQALKSKLKQTEMECEYLKRWFGSLTEQNRRLQREVEELRALKVGPPTVISPHSCEPLPASTLTMCPRCERVTTTGVDKGSTKTTRTAVANPTIAAALSSENGAPALQSRQSC
ncbi:hypothetical protein POTOM_037995 [Populus tomentosa]|uniref:Homeobox domain-containing protein n=1 Tax=Populus tomentosa TaxID=118781 RepID=A0A8X8CKY9_POPTO|nr:hypothetical protein POTOM_037995 [Populus tomentosa]